MFNPKNYVSRIWRPFIPFSTFGVFQRGGYFIVDVIPGKLAVISLNTIYFYDSNKGERVSSRLRRFGAFGAGLRSRDPGIVVRRVTGIPPAFPYRRKGVPVPVLFITIILSRN